MRIPRIRTNPYRLPQPPAPAIEPGSYLLIPIGMVPVTLEQLQVQLLLYRAALEEAQAVARPSILERDLLGVWN